MAKKLSDILGGYKPKAGDEQKFADKHTTEVTDDVNGNGDDVFKGTKVKVADRKNGYANGADAKVYESIEDYTLEEIDEFMQTEEYEQLDEISKTTLGSYIKKASMDSAKKAVRGVDMHNQAQDAKKRANDPKLAYAKSGNEAIAAHKTKSGNLHTSKALSRQAGISKAVERLTKEEVEMNESIAAKVKYLAKKALEKAGGGTDEDQRKRLQKNMGVPQTGKKPEPVKEEAEQIDELSRKTLTNYITKTSKEKGARIGARSSGISSAAKKLAAIKRGKMAESVELEEGNVAQQHFEDYHKSTAQLLKKIHGGLSQHYSNVTDKKNYGGGQAHWGHVGTIKDIHRSLQDICDRIHQEGEYAEPPKVKAIRESLDATLQELYDNLDESNQASMIKIIDEGKTDELLEFIKVLGDE